MSKTILCFVAVLACAGMASAQNGVLLPWVNAQVTDNNGRPLSLGKICSYAAGTNNKLPTYTDGSLTVQNQDPVVLDAAGRASIWIGEASYKIVIQQPGNNFCPGTGAVVRTIDNVADGGELLKLLLSGTSGAGLVGFSQAVTYPPGTVGEKLQQFINVTDAPFNASADSDDNTSAYAAAIGALPANGGTIYIPAGTFKGHFLFPQYPKSVRVLCAGQNSTTLQADAINTPVFAWPDIVANFISGTNEISGCSVKAHASGSTGAAIDMRGSDKAWVHDITFLSNGTGTFFQGILINDQISGRTAGYQNTVERINDVDQVGPNRVVEMSGTVGGNTINLLNVTGDTGVDFALYINGGSQANLLMNIECDGLGDPAVCIQPAGSNWFFNVTCEDGTTHCIIGMGGGNNVFIGITAGSGNALDDPGIRCTQNESGWKFLGSQFVNASYWLAFPQSGCINGGPEVGNALWGVTFGSTNGGYAATQLTGGGLLGCIGINGPASTLTAGTYHYVMTTINGAGQTTGSATSCTITNGQAVSFDIIAPAQGDTRYNIYGRQCPTAATCRLIAQQDATVSNNVGLNVYDTGQAPITATSPPARNGTGDIIGYFRSRWINAGTLNDVAECLTVIAVHCDTLSANNDVRACENGIITAGITTACDAITPGFFPNEWLDGYEVQMYISFSLRAAGTNFFTLEDNRYPIKSCLNPANDIAIAVAAGTRIKLQWIAGGAVPLNVWCLEGQ